ncbi:MAG: hypothetical protein R3D33_16530 [Hyphomicrobiaceae bacterium]
MLTTIRTLLAATVVAVTLSSAPAGAAPAVPAGEAPQAGSLVTEVASWNRGCVWTRDGWFRRGPYNNWVRCRDRGERYDDRYREGEWHDGYSTRYRTYTAPRRTWSYQRNWRRYDRRPSWGYATRVPQSCQRDWHCDDGGNPFDGKRRCYWRLICN